MVVFNDVFFKYSPNTLQGSRLDNFTSFGTTLIHLYQGLPYLQIQKKRTLWVGGYHILLVNFLCVKEHQ